MNEFYIYELIDPIYLIPFYVGKGKGNRIYDHYTNEKAQKYNKNLYNAIKKLKQQNLEPIYNKIEENLTEQEAFKKEKEWIKFYGRENLYNLTDGGEGGNTLLDDEIKKRWKNNCILAQNKLEVKIKKSKSMKGKNILPKSEETKNKMSKIRIEKQLSKGDSNGMFGKTHSRQTIKIMKQKALNRQKIECKYCHKLTAINMYNRWHNKNCHLFEG